MSTSGWDVVKEKACLQLGKALLFGPVTTLLFHFWEARGEMERQMIATAGGIGGSTVKSLKC